MFGFVKSSPAMDECWQMNLQCVWDEGEGRKNTCMGVVYVTIMYWIDPNSWVQWLLMTFLMRNWIWIVVCNVEYRYGVGKYFQ